MENEVWKDIKGYEGLYQVSSLGRVRSLDRMVESKGDLLQFKKGRTLRNTPGNKGYILNTLCRDGKCRTFQTHRIVGIAFIENPENKPQINHKNGVTTDNRVSNLEWVTAQENIRHSFDTGLNVPKVGEDRGNTILTEQQVDRIARMIKDRNSLSSIARVFKVSVGAISQIKRGNSWKHKNIKDLCGIKSNNIPLEDVLKIKKLIKEGVKSREISVITGYSYGSIHRIKKGQRHSNIPWPKPEDN